MRIDGLEPDSALNVTMSGDGTLTIEVEAADGRPTAAVSVSIEQVVERVRGELLGSNRCARCGRRRDDHQVRHPFKSWAAENLPRAPRDLRDVYWPLAFLARTLNGGS